MSVIKSQKMHSTFVRLPQRHLSSTGNHHCCTKTCVELGATTSTLKPDTKQKLLSMISSLEEDYTQQLKDKEEIYQERIRQLEEVVENLKIESNELRLRPPQKIIEIDKSREIQLLSRVAELQKSKNNVVNNKVSFIETNLTTKIHNLQHQLECEKQYSQVEISKLKQLLTNKQQQYTNIINREVNQKQKLDEYCRKLENDINAIHNDNGNTTKIAQNKIQEMEREIYRLKIEVQSRVKDLEKIELGWKEKYNEIKNNYNTANAKYEKVFEEKGKLIETNYATRIELEKTYINKEIQFKELLRKQHERDLQSKVTNISKEWDVKLVAAQQKSAKHLLDQQENWLKNEKILGDQYTRELNSLRLQLQSRNQIHQKMQNEYKLKEKDKHEEWNKLYQQYEREYERRLKQLQQSVPDVNIEEKEKEYIYIEKLVHSQQGKLATQKYLKLSKQMLVLETSFEDLQLQHQKLKNTLNYYKSLQSTFDQEREKWKLQRQEFAQGYEKKENRNDMTWVVQRIINAQNNNQGFRIDSNTKVIPNEHLPCVSYRVVSTEQELAYLLKRGQQQKILQEEKTRL